LLCFSNNSFLDHIHAAFKVQIPLCGVSLLGFIGLSLILSPSPELSLLTIIMTLYLSNIYIYPGDVYLRAWRQSEGQMLLKLEHSCLQDFMAAGVNGGVVKTVSAVARILKVFHDAKRVKAQGQAELEECLYRS